MGRFVKDRKLGRTGSGRFCKENGNGCGKHLFPKERETQSHIQEWRQVHTDYILCRRGNLKEIRDCKVVAGESVAKQHGMVVCEIMKMRKRKSVKTEQKIKWWKLRKDQC